jgi:putative addiction module component (TIGR02574 family)
MAKGTLFDLSAAEKLQLVEDLWDDLAATPEAVPVHDWQAKEIAARRERLRARPDTGMIWADVLHHLRARNEK